MKRVKGEMAEEADLSLSNNLDDAVDGAERDLIAKIKATLKAAIDDIDSSIDLRDYVTKAINNEVNDAIAEEAYIHIGDFDGKIHAYVSLPIGFGSENEPSWMFDIMKAFDEYAESLTCQKPSSSDIASITTVRDALLKAAEKFNSIIGKSSK